MPQASKTIFLNQIQRMILLALVLLDGGVACGDEVWDAKRVPVERIETRLEGAPELAGLLAEQLAFDGVEGVHHRVVGGQHEVNPVHAHLVLLLLEGHVEGHLRDAEAHAVEVAGLADEMGEVVVEVCGYAPVFLAQDGLLEVFHGDLVDALAPGAEPLLLEIHHRLGQRHVFVVDVAADLLLHHLV
eukprot:scaffold117564_cov45-Prasinocladus_malaysianus.AAC.6